MSDARRMRDRSVPRHPLQAALPVRLDLYPRPCLRLGSASVASIGLTCTCTCTLHALLATRYFNANGIATERYVREPIKTDVEHVVSDRTCNLCSQFLVTSFACMSDCHATSMALP